MLNSDMKEYAPIALFVFNRPEHTAKTLAALQLNAEAKKTDLFVFADGPRGQEDLVKIKAVRDLFLDLSGFKTISLIEQKENFGLAKSIINGVSKICDSYGRVIVVEDDLLSSAYFLQYMNEGLNRYQDELEVASIHGYMYPVPNSLPETFFLRGADCWGWATWKRAWDLFEVDGSILLNKLLQRKLNYKFDYDGNAAYVKMLRDQIKGKNNSWAIRWHASMFLLNMLTLYPARSLVDNFGFDASGTHCSASNNYKTIISETPIVLGTIAVEENIDGRIALVGFFRRLKVQRPLRAIKKLWFKIFNWYKSKVE